MTDDVLGALFCVAFLTAAWGWGALVARWLRLADSGVDLCLYGIAAIVALGGLLNLLHIAFWPVIVALAGGGVLNAVRLRGSAVFRGAGAACSNKWFVPVGVASALALQALVTVGFPRVFNWHDDLEKYLRHPVRMLAMGSVSAGPFDAMGTESFGGAAFLQAYAVGCFGPFAAHLVDGVVGLFLLLLIAVQSARRLGLHPGWATVVIAAVFMVDPGCVNISSVYLPAALLMYLISKAWLHRGPRSGAESALAGLLVAALVALKGTFVPFAVFFTAGIGLAEFVETRRVPRCALIVVAVGLLAVVPWVAVHWGSAYSWASILVKPSSSIDAGGIGPLRFVGGEMAASLRLFGVVGSATLLAVWFGWSRSEGGRASWSQLLRVVVPVTGVLLVGASLAIRGVSSVEQMLRYLAPFAVAAVGVAGILLLVGCRSFPVRAGVFATMLVYGPGLYERISSAYVHRTMVQLPRFVTHPAVVGFNAASQSPEAEYLVAAVQRGIPAGEPMAAWTQLSYLLDYERNPIVDIAPAGLESPEARWRVERDQGFLNALRAQGIHYLLFQVGGGIRTIEGFEHARGIRSSRERAICDASIRFLREIQERRTVPGAVAVENEWLVVLRL